MTPVNYFPFQKIKEMKLEHWSPAVIIINILLVICLYHMGKRGSDHCMIPTADDI